MSSPLSTVCLTVLGQYHGALVVLIYLRRAHLVYLRSQEVAQPQYHGHEIIYSHQLGFG